MRRSHPVFDHPEIRYFLGDVRDASRLERAFNEVDSIVHAAALKQVPAGCVPSIRIYQDLVSLAP